MMQQLSMSDHIKGLHMLLLNVRENRMGNQEYKVQWNMILLML